MPILDQNSSEFLSRSADQTRRVGMRLGGILEKGDVICLEGELGTGKTTLVQGIGAGWGSTDQVTSPTFVLVNIYRRADDERLAHLDAYRLGDAAEAQSLDLDELSLNGPMVVEWADHIIKALPKDHMWIDMSWNDEELRGMQFTAHGARYQKLLHQFQEALFGVT